LLYFSGASDRVVFICSSLFLKSTVNVYDAKMSREDYALVGLLCGGDYDAVSGLQAL
jgi:hypothetical protein